MNSNLKQLFSAVVAVLVFAVVLLFSSAFLKGLRLDMTEHKLFTLSSGSQRIIESIEEPIHLYYFFSEESSRELTQLRTYADRVEALLDEYVSLSDGNLILTQIDPMPFSEAEDQADGFGLQKVPVGSAGEGLYFGLVGSNALDNTEVIGFFQPDRETFLEYEISQLLFRLIQIEKPKIGLISSLPVRDRVNPETFRSEPGWQALSELERNFEVVDIAADAERIDPDVSLLLMIHPKSVSDTLQASIRAFLMREGAIIAFVDPLAEMDQAAPSPMMPTLPQGQASDLNWLTEDWGVALRAEQILGDAQLALSVTGQNGAPTRHLGILGLGPTELNPLEVPTASLESINVASAGLIDVFEAKLAVTPLLSSSNYAGGMDAAQFQFLQDPSDLQKTFVPGSEAISIAVALSGVLPASEVLADPAAGAAPVGINLILVSDTDVLSDRLWVQVQNFFGEPVATAWADNGSFLVNSVEHLAGSADLISIRSRGRYTRPFDVVQDLKREAETRYSQSAALLQVELAETEQRLLELEAQKTTDGLLTLSPEQALALEAFQDQKLSIRKQLREVRHGLDRDIQGLGANLKLINIAVMPVLLTVLLGLYVGLRRVRRQALADAE